MLQYQQKQGHWLSQLETGPTFHPTFEEFQDPIAYIRSIQSEGSKHGASIASVQNIFRSTKGVGRTAVLCRHLQNRAAGGAGSPQWSGERHFPCILSPDLHLLAAFALKNEAFLPSGARQA